MVAPADLQQRITFLLEKSRSFGGFAESNAIVCLEALSNAIEKKNSIFAIEPWHKLRDDVTLQHPGEMLLRVKDANGTMLAPYPAIMAFYNNHCAAEIDTVLVLCALWQYGQDDETQVSVNISGESLRNADFIRAVLPAIEIMALKGDQKIIFEIHESTGEVMSQKVLDLCRRLGIAFAIDDVGLSMTDIFRLSEFEGIADFVKLDRKSVTAPPEDKASLQNIMNLLSATLPKALVVAEGVQSADHAAEILAKHPRIHYAQGLYLPDRETFARQWAEIKQAA